MSPLKLYQYSLRSLLLFVTFGVVLSAFIKRVGSEIALQCIGLVYCIGLLLAVLIVIELIDRLFKKIHYRGIWLFAPLLYFLLPLGFSLFDGLIDKPASSFFFAHWHPSLSSNDLFKGCIVCAIMSFFICFDGMSQKHYFQPAERDFAYYPRLSTLRSHALNIDSKAIFFIGCSLILWYFFSTTLDLYRSTIGQGMVVGESLERIFTTCMAGWGLLWIVDCLSRPRRETLLAAIGFVL